MVIRATLNDSCHNSNYFVHVTEAVGVKVVISTQHSSAALGLYAVGTDSPPNDLMQGHASVQRHIITVSQPSQSTVFDIM